MYTQSSMWLEGGKHMPTLVFWEGHTMKIKYKRNFCKIIFECGSCIGYFSYCCDVEQEKSNIRKEDVF